MRRVLQWKGCHFQHLVLVGESCVYLYLASATYCVEPAIYIEGGKILHFYRAGKFLFLSVWVVIARAEDTCPPSLLPLLPPSALFLDFALLLIFFLSSSYLCTALLALYQLVTDGFNALIMYGYVINVNMSLSHK